jgi:hypothetical protein
MSKLKEQGQVQKMDFSWKPSAKPQTYIASKLAFNVVRFEGHQNQQKYVFFFPTLTTDTKNRIGWRLTTPHARHTQILLASST